MHFDWTVNIPGLIAAVVVAGGFIKAHVSNREELATIRTKVNLVWGFFKRQYSLSDDGE